MDIEEIILSNEDEIDEELKIEKVNCEFMSKEDKYLTVINNNKEYLSDDVLVDEITSSDINLYQTVSEYSVEPTLLLSKIVNERILTDEVFSYAHSRRIGGFLKKIIEDNNLNFVDIFDDTILILNFNGDSCNSNPKLEFPDDFIENIQKSTKRIILIPLSLRNYGSKSNHSNFIIIDTEKKEIERFEPHGNFGRCENRMTLIVDHIVSNFLIDLYDESFYYYNPSSYCPNFGPQSVIKYDEGYCVVFSTLYSHLRIINIDKSRELIIKYIYNLTNDPENPNFMKKYIAYTFDLSPDSSARVKIAKEERMRIEKEKRIEQMKISCRLKSKELDEKCRIENPEEYERRIKRREYITMIKDQSIPVEEKTRIKKELYKESIDRIRENNDKRKHDLELLRTENQEDYDRIQLEKETKKRIARENFLAFKESRLMREENILMKKEEARMIEINKIEKKDRNVLIRTLILESLKKRGLLDI